MVNKNRKSFKKYVLVLLSLIPVITFAEPEDNSQTAVQNGDVISEPPSEPTLLPTIWLGVLDSSVFNPMAHGRYGNYFSPRDAGTLMIDFGPDEFRMDLTWAHVLTPKQRFKLSAQHLSQRNATKFATPSVGNEFIGQNNVGAEYEYAFSKPWLKVFDVQGYYFSANNGNLGDISFTEGQEVFLDQRTLIGGEGGGVSAGPRWQVWRGGEFGLAANYDEVYFDAQVPGNIRSSEGFGSTLSFGQSLSPKFNVELVASFREIYTRYTAEINWIAHQTPTHRWGLQLTGSHISSDLLQGGEENVIGLNLVYRWDGKTRISRQQPVCFLGDDSCDLVTWASHSAADVPDVFVQNNEQIIPVN